MRSFLSPERSRTDAPESPAAALPSWLHTIHQGLQGVVRQNEFNRETTPTPSSSFLENLSALKEKVLKNKQIQLWESRRYFEAWSFASNETDQHTIHNQLRADISSFFDEYAFLRSKVSYDYGLNGIQNGYSESMSTIAENFLEKMRTEERPIERAELELDVSHYVEAWMRSPKVQVGEKIMMISPRGSQAELYPGLDERNYVFVNVYEKTEAGFTFQQYRNYDANAYLPQLQKTLAQSLGGSLQKITNRHPDYDTHATIATAVYLPSEVSMEQVEAVVYKNKAKWKTNIDRDLPQLPAASMQEKLKEVTAFCLAEFTTLAGSEYSLQEKNLAFNLLVRLVKNTLLKWVENNATNYDPAKQKDFVFDLQTIKSAWHLEFKQQLGEKLDTEEKKLVKFFKTSIELSNTLPLKSMAQWAHCVTGTPLSLLRMKALTSNKLFMDISGSSYGSTEISIQQKQEMKKQLEGYIRLTIHGETWFVPPDYLTEKGCYFDEKTGLVMGPCDLPLEEDPYALTLEEYTSIMEELNQLRNDPDLNALSLSEQERVIQLYYHLRLKLFVSSASFQQILQQDILVTKTDLDEELHDLHDSLRVAIDPFIGLLRYLVQLSENSDAEKLVTLEEVAQVKTHRNYQPLIFLN